MVAMFDKCFADAKVDSAHIGNAILHNEIVDGGAKTCSDRVLFDGNNSMVGEEEKREHICIKWLDKNWIEHSWGESLVLEIRTNLQRRFAFVAEANDEDFAAADEKLTFTKRALADGKLFFRCG